MNLSPSLEELHIYNVDIDYRNILGRQRFGEGLKILKFFNKKDRKTEFDVKDIESLVRHFKNLEGLELEDCHLTDEIAYILLSGLPKLSRFCQKFSSQKSIFLVFLLNFYLSVK